MLDRTGTKFSHVKPGDTPWKGGGLRDFFLYRDLGVAEATHGRVIAHLVKANEAPEKGTGWHRHEAEFQIVYMTKRPPSGAGGTNQEKATRHVGISCFVR